jgi:hypothetical protein
LASDAALRAVLRGRPCGVAELLEVRGIGPAFCEKHGQSLLDALAALAAGEDAASASAGRGASPRASTAIA